MRDMPVAKFQRLARYHGFHPEPEPELGVFRSTDGTLEVPAVNNGKRGDTAMERVDRRATLLAMAAARAARRPEVDLRGGLGLQADATRAVPWTPERRSPIRRAGADRRPESPPAGDMSALPVPVEHRAARAPNNEEAPGVAAPRASI